MLRESPQKRHEGWKPTLVSASLWTLAPLFFILALMGTVHAHTAVPIWDMWTGYLDFYQQLRAGHTAAWWNLHNEHRIVLSKILFWIDLAWFQGSVWFLLVVHFVCVGGAFWTLRALLHEKAAACGASHRSTQLATLFIFICLFSWAQSQNFSWGFQNQFFLAQLLPLLALYSLYQSGKNQSTPQFLAAAVLGCLSILTMANGVLALPLMAAYALLQRMGWKKTSLLCALAVACIAVYFANYHVPYNPGRIIAPIQPWPTAQYSLVYLGLPFYYFSGKSLWCAQIFGLLFLLLTGVKALQCLRQPTRQGIDLCLLAFIAYIVGTALVTALGRAQFGLAQAVSSRYATPALMAWVALLIAYLPPLLKSLEQWQNRVVWPLLLLLLAMLATQLPAREPQTSVNHEATLAALALELGVHDAAQIQTVVWDATLAERIAQPAIAHNDSIFGQAPIRDARQRLGQLQALPLPARTCLGAVDAVLPLSGDPRYQKISGWLLSAHGRDGRDGFEALQLLNAQGRNVGYAVMGAARPELRADYGQRAHYRGFQGYVQTGQATAPLSLLASDHSCQASTATPSTPSATSATPTKTQPHTPSTP